MIIFDRLWITMEKRNISTYRLREDRQLDNKTIRRLRANDNMETKTLDKLCSILECNIEDIAEFKSDVNGSESQKIEKRTLHSFVVIVEKAMESGLSLEEIAEKLEIDI